MAERVEVGKIASVGPDYIMWQNGTKKLCVTFANDWMFTKEERAESFRPFVGKDAAIPVDGPFFIGLDFFPGYFDGSVRVIKLQHKVASVVACEPPKVAKLQHKVASAVVCEPPKDPTWRAILAEKELADRRKANQPVPFVWRHAKKRQRPQ